MADTRFYDQNFEELFEQYRSFNPADIHDIWADRYLPTREPGRACDIGAGSGRDANWLAEQGWDVVAVEPSNLRELAEKDSHPNVVWEEDSLPDLSKLRARDHQFDLILLNGVFQHIRPTQRERVFRILCNLLKPGGLLVISLRQGTDAKENKQRAFNTVNSEEITTLGKKCAVVNKTPRENTKPDLVRDHITWQWHLFELPDDGTGGLPLLRHIIVNDAKSASYKLGLLRCLTRLAETSPGIVMRRTDEYVEIPFGAVGLYWIKLYKSLLIDKVFKQQSRDGGYGFAKEAFKKLEKFAQTDIFLGARFNDWRATVIQTAIKDACNNIKANPAHFTTYPGSPNKQIFECSSSRVSKPKGSIQLNKEFLAQFGTFRIPAHIWQALTSLGCWIDPVIVREWRQLILPWQDQSKRNLLSVDVFEWSENSRRETHRVSFRAREIRDEGYPLTCVWSAKSIGIRSKLAIDHCFPWSRWPNNDLWNLLPTRDSVNSAKSDKLPAAELLFDARPRIIDWWEEAWVGTDHEQQFKEEADNSLPECSENSTLEQIYKAIQHQQMKIKGDQQLAEWKLSEAVD